MASTACTFPQFEPHRAMHGRTRVVSALFATAIALVLTLAGCGGGGDSSGNNNNPPPPTTATVSGQVVSSSTGQAVSGAAVRSGGVSTTTDGTGRYTLNNVPAGTSVVVNFDSSGYAPTLARVALKAGGSLSANARLTPVAASVQFDAAAGTVATVPNSTAQVALPAGGLVNAASGAAASGSVTVDLAPIDPAADAGNMPGDFQSSTGAIESFGALNVTLRDANGNRLNLANGQTSTIRIPVSTRAPSLTPTMPLYYLDETSGLWVQQGTATLQGVAPALYYEGTVGHFSVWNIDRPAETLFLTGCLVDDQNKAVPNATVETNGQNYSGKGSSTTDANGNFSVGMMRGTGVAAVFATSGGRFSNVVQAGPSDNNITLPNCLKMANGSTPATVVQGPSDQAVPAGMPAVFSAQAIGSGAVSYQWKRNGSDIAGATQTSYFLVTTLADNGARFSVTVSNAFGSATSNEATLTVGAPAAPQILRQPADQQVQVGATATFSVDAAAFGQTLTYQWRRNGTPIGGATGSSYTTPATTLADDGTLFSVVVTASAGGSITSNDARLGVSNATAPSITQQPQNATVTVGQSGVFSVVATGTPAPTYQWSRSGVVIAGATSATYTTPATQLSDSGATFTVTVTNSLGSVTSNAATLTVTQATGGAGYYHVAGAGPTSDITITYANGAQTVPSQALMGVRDDAPANGAVTVEPTGGTGIVPFNAFEATIAGGQITNARTRISSYIKNGRFWKVDQLVTSGAPTPQMVSTVTPADVCGSSGLPLVPFGVDSSDWANAALGWILMRSPGPDGLCGSTDDTFRAVRMNMSDTTAPLVIGEPLAQIRGSDGSFAGLVVRNGTQVQQLNADLAAPANLFTVDPATFVNGGAVFGSAPPGLWVFVDGRTLYAVNLANPANRAPVATLATGETLMSHFSGDGTAAYVALNTATAGRILRIDTNLTATAVTTLDAPAADLALTTTRVAARLSSTPARVVSALKTGSTMQNIITLPLGDLAMLMMASGENVYLTKFGTGATLGVVTLIVNSDGTNTQTLAGTRLLHSIGPETMAMAGGLNQTYAIVVADGESAAGLDSGATLRLVEGATRNTLATYGTFPASPAGQAVMFAPAPLQYRQTGLVPFLGGSTTTAGDLYFFKSDVAGLLRVTTFVQ